MNCLAGGKLAQTYAQNLNAGAAGGYPRVEYANNNLMGRATGAWEGCCLMAGTSKAGDTVANAVAITTLAEGAPANSLVFCL